LVDDAGASVLVIWGPNELGQARAIADTDPDGRARAILAPPTNLDELLAVLRRASVVVAGGTGPPPPAAALGTRCGGRYRPASVERNGPYGRGHRTLASPDHTMDSLAVEPVLRAVGEILDGPATDSLVADVSR